MRLFNLSQADDDISVEEARAEIAKIEALKNALVQKKTALVADDFASLTAPSQWLKKVLQAPLMEIYLVYGIPHGAEEIGKPAKPWS